MRQGDYSVGEIAIFLLILDATAVVPNNETGRRRVVQSRSLSVHVHALWDVAGKRRSLTMQLI